MSEECEKCKECDEFEMVFVLCLQIFETSAIAGPRSTKGADNGPHLYIIIVILYKNKGRTGMSRGRSLRDIPRNSLSCLSFLYRQVCMGMKGWV